MICEIAIENNHLLVRLHDEKNIEEYYDKKAQAIVKRNLDTLKYEGITIKGNSIELKSKAVKVILKDANALIENKLTEIFPNTSKNIFFAIIKKKTKENAHKIVKSIPGRVLISSAGILSAYMIISTHIENKNEIKENIVYEENHDYDSYNNMLDELDENTNLENKNEDTIVKQSNNTVNIELDSENEDKQTIDIESNIDYETKQIAYDGYNELVSYYAEKWGLSSNIPMCVLTQESAGLQENLMQIQFHSWEDMPLTTFNYLTNKNETIVLTKDSSKYNGKNYICISNDDLKNPKTNISVGCIILKKSIEYMNNHIAAGIQCYNFGKNNMDKVLQETEKNTGVSVKEILEDQKNIDFQEYTNIINVGDPNYLENVTRYIQENDNTFTVKVVDENGNITENNISINVKSK